MGRKFTMERVSYKKVCIVHVNTEGIGGDGRLLQSHFKTNFIFYNEFLIQKIRVSVYLESFL